MSDFEENGKKFIAEGIGAFILALLSIIAHRYIGSSAMGYADFISLLFYTVGVILLAYAIISVSGCHINPVVSVGAFVNGEINGKQCMGYIVSQLIGGALAGLLVFGVLSLEGHAPHGGHVEPLEVPAILLLEFGLVFVFTLLVLGAVGKFEHTKAGGLVVGATLVVEHLFAVLLHGATVNPAVKLGEVFLVGDIGGAFGNYWLYLVGPALGALVAGLAAKFLFPHHGEHH